MTDFTWPSTIIPSSSDWRLISNTAAFASPLNGTTRTLSRGGDRWACTLTFNVMTQDNSAVLRAFLANLRGQTHRVVLPDHAYKKRGIQTAAILVNGGSQTGSTLVCDGASAGITNALRAADLIQVGNYLHMVTADANSDGSGNLTLSIVPPLRASPADNATVSVGTPTARFLLTGNTVGWSNRPGGWPRTIQSYSVDFIEDLA